MNAKRVRQLLLAVGFLVLAAVAWSVLTREPPRVAEGDPAAKMGEGVVLQRDSPHTEIHEGEKAGTEALGSRLEVDKYGKQVWKDFDLSHDLDDGRKVRVKADQASYDQRTGDFEVKGHVEVTTSDGYRLAGNSLSHQADKGGKQDVYESQEPMEFARPDISGKAGKLKVDLASRVYELWDGATFVVDRGEGEAPVNIEGPRAVHDDVQRLGRFPEGATVSQDGSKLQADVLEVFLRAKEERGLRSVLARGHVLVNRRPAAAGSAPGSDRGGAAQAVAGAQTLQADVVNVEYAADGRDVERVLATRGSQPAAFQVIPEDPAEGPRNLQADAIDVTYSGGAPSRIVADGSVVLTVFDAGGAPARTVTAARAEASLVDGDVSDLKFEGDVVIVEAARTAKADRATYDRQGGRMMLTSFGEGGTKPEVVEGDSVLKAHEIVSRRSEDLLLATGEVELTYVEKEKVPGKGQGLEGLLGKTREPVRVLAGKMTSKSKIGEAVFEEDVRLWKGRTVIESPKVTTRREGRELVAENGAKLVMEQAAPEDGSPKDPVRVEAWKLILDDSNHKVTCMPGPGIVRIQQGKSVITGKDAVFELDPETSTVRTGHVKENVTVADGGREGTGSEVTFDVAHGRRVVLRGSDEVPARMSSARGVTRGEELTFYLDEDIVSVAGGRVDTTLEIGTGAGVAGSDTPRF